MRTCSKCGESKADTEFYYSTAKQTLRPQCKACECARFREYYQTHRQQIRVKSRTRRRTRYHSDPEWRERQIAHSKRWNDTHPEQYGAIQKAYRERKKKIPPSLTDTVTMKAVE